MPYRAGRICAHPGCNEIVYTGSRCRAHVETFHDQPYRQWYRSSRWREIRTTQLQREPWCAMCMAEGRMTPATEVDHIIPHRGNEHKFYSGPFQSLCGKHHAMKTHGEIYS